VERTRNLRVAFFFLPTPICHTRNSRFTSGGDRIQLSNKVSTYNNKRKIFVTVGNVLICQERENIECCVNSQLSVSSELEQIVILKEKIKKIF